MLYRKLGRTGLEVSILGFGCMRLPVLNGQEDQIDQDYAAELIRYSINEGVNYLDTAYPYHNQMSEPFLGKALQDGYREKIYLATKLPCWEIKQKEDCDKFLDLQLQRLNTDHIDLYLLHNPKREWWHRLLEMDVLDFLDRALGDGRIGYAGFSFHDELDHFKNIVESFDWDFCQIQYNFMDEDIQAGKQGLQYAYSQGLGVVVMEPLRGGHLAGPMPEDIQALWDSAPVKRSPAEWALRWIWDQPQVSVVLSGMNSMSQVKENCRIAQNAMPGMLSSAEYDIFTRVKNLYKERIKIPCTGCGYCMPCPSGVNIPRIFSIYNDRWMYGDERWTRIMYNIGTNSQELASNCSKCAECEELCPQEIPIPEMLQKCHTELSSPEN